MDDEANELDNHSETNEHEEELSEITNEPDELNEGDDEFPEVFGEVDEDDSDLPEIFGEVDEDDNDLPEIFGELDEDEIELPEIFDRSAENEDKLNAIIKEREEGEGLDENQASRYEGDVYENIGSESTTTVLMGETENTERSLEQEEEIEKDKHDVTEEFENIEEINETPDEITSAEEFEYLWDIREKLDHEGKSEEEIKEVMHEAEEMYKALKEVEKLYEQQEQEKLKQVDHEGEATNEDLKEEIDRVDLVEQAVEIEENMAQQGIAQEEMDEKVEEALEKIELEEELEKTHEQQEQEKVKEIDHEDEAINEDLKEEIDRVDLVEQAVEIEENMNEQGIPQEEIDNEVEKAMEMSELNEEIKKLYEEHQREKIRQANHDDEESGEDPREEIDRPAEAEYYMEKEEDLHRQGITQEEIDEQMEEIANEYQEDLTGTQEKTEEPNSEKLENSEVEMIEQNSNTEQRKQNEQISSLTNEKKTKNSEIIENKEKFIRITPEIEPIESESEEKKEIIEENSKVTRERTEEEEEDEHLQELYRQETGRRPIYSGEKTKGYIQWLKEQEEESEKIKNSQSESQQKKEIEEEDWKKILKRWIKETSEDECSTELKSKLKKAIEGYNEFENLIRKFMELYEKYQHEKLSGKEHNRLNSLTEKLQEFDQSHLELLVNIRAIKKYIVEEYWWDSMNKFRANRMQNNFFEQISQRYKNLRQKMLERDDTISETEVILMDQTTSLAARKYYGFIYMVIDTIDNKKYIGQTVQTLEARLSQHLSNPPNKYFAKALQKHGKKKFVLKEISKTYSVNEANRLERYYIAKYRTYIALHGTKYGYNVSKGGEQFVPSGESHPNYKTIEADDLEHLIRSGFFKEEIARELNIHNSSLNRKIKEFWFSSYKLRNIKQAREFFGGIDEWKKRIALIAPTYREIDREYFKSLIIKGLFIEEIAYELDIGLKTIIHKIDELWGEEFDIHNLSEARQLFGGEKIFQKKYSEICRNKALGRRHSERTKNKISISTSGTSNPRYTKISKKKLKSLIIQLCNTSTIAENLKIGRGSVNNKIEEFWSSKYGISNLTQARKFFKENPNKI